MNQHILIYNPILEEDPSDLFGSILQKSQYQRCQIEDYDNKILNIEDSLNLNCIMYISWQNLELINNYGDSQPNYFVGIYFNKCVNSSVSSIICKHKVR